MDGRKRKKPNNEKIENYLEARRNYYAQLQQTGQVTQNIGHEYRQIRSLILPDANDLESKDTSEDLPQGDLPTLQLS